MRNDFIIIVSKVVIERMDKQFITTHEANTLVAELSTKIEEFRQNRHIPYSIEVETHQTPHRRPTQEELAHGKHEAFPDSDQM